MEAVLSPLAGVIGLVAYGVLIAGIVKSGKKQSFAAFMLWAMLDGIATVTTILEGGNYWLPLSNVAGSAFITGLLVVKKQVSWSWVETCTSLLVVICLTVWAIAGGQAGIVSSSIAVVIASIPQMVDTFKKPSGTSTLAYAIFLCANIISLIAGKTWTIEERLYAACSVSLCVVIIIFSLKRERQSR